MDMKRNINFKNVLCMAAITLVTGMLGGCEDNSIATPVGKLPNETALDNNFGMLKCDMTTSDLEITMTNTKTPDFAFFYQTVKPVAQDTRITMKIDLDLVDKYNEEHGTEYRKMSTISIEGISNDGAMTIKAGDTMSDTIMVRLNPLGTLHDYSLLPITVELPEESGIRPSRDSNEIYYKIYYKRSTYPWLSPMKADMKKYKMLFAGESWLTHNMEVKGWDDFSVGGYGTEIDRIHAAMDEFAEITHLPSHLVGEKFPSTMEELKTYDVVILSDVGANTLLLHPLVFTQSVRFPNRLQLLADYVEQGGALGMMGGYMTFQGIGGKGCYHGSPIEKALPVDFLPYDDRQEHPEGIDLKVDPQRHPALKGLPEEWPYLLGYNKAVAKPGAQVAVEYQGDPILSFYEYGKGRSFAWASDCAPHWMPPAFCEWEYIHLFWKNMIDWVVQR